MTAINAAVLCLSTLRSSPLVRRVTCPLQSYGSRARRCWYLHTASLLAPIAFCCPVLLCTCPSVCMYQVTKGLARVRGYCNPSPMAGSSFTRAAKRPFREFFSFHFPDTQYTFFPSFYLSTMFLRLIFRKKTKFIISRERKKKNLESNCKSFRFTTLVRKFINLETKRNKGEI